MGGVRQPWDWVSPRIALWLAMRLDLFLGRGRMQFSYERGATEVAWCEVGCARAGAPAQETWVQARNELPRGCVENKKSSVASFCFPIGKVGVAVLFYHVRVKSRG